MRPLNPVAPGEGATHLVADRVEIPVGPGSTVVICSDLHLTDEPTAASRLVTRELGDRLRELTGPATVVLNGDCFELLLARRPSVRAALEAHPDFADALAAFGRDAGRPLVVTVGSHDARLAWDESEAAVLRDGLGATIALSADLLLTTDRGVRVVRVEHGHQFDPAHARRDARDPLDSPLGQHLAQEVVPELTRRPFLADAPALSDPDQLARFVGSRIVYRELLGRAGWLVVPLVLLLLAIRTPVIVAAMSVSQRRQEVQELLLVGAAGMIVDLAVLGALIVVVARRAFRSLTSARLGARADHCNEPPRSAAEALCAQGFAGLVTGHTHHPELMPLREGFYANSGCGLLAVEPRSTRGGLPPAFAGVLRRSWLELTAGRDVEARLVIAETPVPGATRLERLVTRPPRPVPTVPTVVSTSPGGPGWPLDRAALTAAPNRRRDRRAAALYTLVVAVVGVYSAITPPSRGRLRLLLDTVPLELPQAASASLVFASIALLLLARGLRRGNRLAWLATVAVLGVSALLHLLKGGDVEEALLSAALCTWLVTHSGAFQVRPDSASVRRAVLVAMAGAAIAVSVSEALVLAFGTHRPTNASIGALVERLAGNTTVALPGATPFVTPALAATGIGLVLAAALALVGPRRPPRPTPEQHRADRARARRVVEQYGGDTLGYFALRDDKSWFFSGASVVAYAVRNGVCLVSPDPIGPVDEWADTWSEFVAFADRHGWSLAVIGAGPGWLPVYEAAGMQTIYMGDEAIVDCQAFTLDGGTMKGLRGSYNRVKKAGYTTVFLSSDAVDATMEASLREMMADTRQGETERGFSMTLSRVFDPDDKDLLLSVALDPSGRPAAFCQWVPAADVAGWSLDLTRRRADPDQPNGVSDFLIVETILHLKATHQMGLGLNFAVMREIVAGEREGGFSNLERRILHKFSETMQIESLWRYNEKFRPYWRPRYVVVDAVEHAAAQTVAIAGAESIWELPVLGRFLRPPAPPGG